MSPELAGRFVRESVSEYSEFALPTDANTLGNVLGGKVMHLVDLAAALAAVRHARCPVVTASVDQMTFLHPVHIGQLIILQSSVTGYSELPWKWECGSRWRICLPVTASTPLGILDVCRHRQDGRRVPIGR